MNSMIPLVLLLVLGVLVASSYQNINSRLLCVVATLLAVLVLCYLNMREGFSDYAPVLHKMGQYGGKCYSSTGVVYPQPDSYTGLRLQSAPRRQVPLLSDTTIFTPVGDGIRLTSDPVSGKFPSVDGREDSPKHLFMLAHNQHGPECCLTGGTFSSSLGCVCTTPEQRNYINTRGGNRTHPDEF